MTTITWIYIVGAVWEASIVTVAFFGIRSHRAHLRRQHLIPAILTAIPWLVFPLIFSIFFHSVIPIFVLASVAGIYVPYIYWILKAPNDNHVA
jgi:hypothetical protein